MRVKRTIRYFPQRTSTHKEVMREIAEMIKRAGADFCFQCPEADIDALLHGVVPTEISVLVYDASQRSGPRPDFSFIRSYNSSIFREVTVAETVTPIPDDHGCCFQDYVIIGLADWNAERLCKTGDLG